MLIPGDVLLRAARPDATAWVPALAAYTPPVITLGHQLIVVALFLIGLSLPLASLGG